MGGIFVTGARGLLGCDLVPHLRSLGHTVVAHARQKVADVNGDLANLPATLDILDSVRPQVIVNLAANTDVDDCERRPQAAYLANVLVVENLAEWIRRGERSCRLVHISTDQVYDGPGPHAERDVTITNYYAFSKYAGELAAAAVDGVNLRTNFYGPSHCEGRASFSDWLIRSFRQSSPITVFEDVYFSPLSITRLCSAIGAVVANFVPGTYNLGCSEGMSKAAFALALGRTLGLSTEHATVGTSVQAKLAAYRPKDMRMDSTHFQRTFGIALPTLLEEIDSMRVSHAQ